MKNDISHVANRNCDVYISNDIGKRNLIFNANNHSHFIWLPGFTRCPIRGHPQTLPPGQFCFLPGWQGPGLWLVLQLPLVKVHCRLPARQTCVCNGVAGCTLPTYVHCHEVLFCGVQDLEHFVHQLLVSAAVRLQQDLHVSQLAEVEVPLSLKRLHVQLQLLDLGVQLAHFPGSGAATGRRGVAVFAAPRSCHGCASTAGARCSGRRCGGCPS